MAHTPPPTTLLCPLRNSCPGISHDSLQPRGPEPRVLLYPPNKPAFHTLPTYLASKERAFWQPGGCTSPRVPGLSSLRTGSQAEKVLTQLESLTTRWKLKAYSSVPPSNLHLSSQNQIKQKQTQPELEKLAISRRANAVHSRIQLTEAGSRAMAAGLDWRKT